MKRAGVTLIELLIYIVALAVVLSATFAVVIGMQRGYVRQRETARSDDALRVTSSTLVTLLRGAGANPFGITGPLLDPDPTNSGVFTQVRIISDFNPADGDVTDPLEDVEAWVASDTFYVRWQSGQVAAPVAFPVRSLQFAYFAADGTALTTKASVASAVRLRLALTAPRHTRTTVLSRRETWVQLRNRN